MSEFKLSKGKEFGVVKEEKFPKFEHFPGSMSPVYKVDERVYNNVDFGDIYDKETKVIKLFQI